MKCTTMNKKKELCTIAALLKERTGLGLKFVNRAAVETITVIIQVELSWPLQARAMTAKRRVQQRKGDSKSEPLL